LTDDQRAKISAKLSEVRAACESDDAPDNQKARLGLVANMLMAYPMAGGSEDSGRARAQAYLGAIDDIPPWAIAETIKRWHRGECGPDHNYRFAPAPAELRGAAMRLLQPGKQTIAHLESLLHALTLDRAMDPTPIETPRRGVWLRAM
jgi:hypothetical protein